MCVCVSLCDCVCVSVCVCVAGLEKKVFRSSCLKYSGEFSFGGFDYHVSGVTDGKTQKGLHKFEI